MFRTEVVSAETAKDTYAKGYQPKWKKRNQPEEKHFSAPFFGSKNANAAPPKSTKTAPNVGGFFSGSAYGKIRSATQPNPSASNEFKTKKFDEEENGNYNEGSGFRHGAPSRGNFGKPFNSNHNSGFNNQRGGGAGNSFRGQRRGGNNFRGGRGYHRGGNDRHESESMMT